MVHAHSLPSSPRFPLDGPRIAANTGAILINGVLLLLLITPLTSPRWTEPRADLDPVIVPITRIKEPPPPPPPPPTRVPINTQPAPQRVPIPQPIAQTPPTPVVDPLPSDTGPVVSEAPADPAPTDNLGSGPVLGAHLQVISNPPPPYPPAAVREGLQGVVELEILVGIDGKPLEVRIARSSGHRPLDQAARKIVLSRWTFQPAMRGGQPVQALGRVPIEFKLDR